AHEIIEGVLGIELSGAIPIKTLLLDGTDHGTLRRRGGILPCFGGADTFAVAALRFVGYELDVLELKAEVVDGLADEVAVSLADMTELRVGHADEQDAALRVIEARRLQPGFVGGAVDFFFQRVENAHPRIDRGRTEERHKKLSTGS